MKRFLSLLLLPAALFAAEVSTDDAARAAKAWVDRGYAMGRLPAGREVAHVKEIEDAETGARLLLASFEGGGWVLLSADDLVDPVIAFAEEGDGFDVDDENPFWTLLRGDIAAREAAAGVVRDGEPAPTAGEGEGGGATEPTAAQRKWASLLDDAPAPTALSTISDVRVEPFVTTHWGQSSGYSNYYTPIVNGSRSVCGCVATALSQIMRYYRFPTAAVTPQTKWCETNGVSFQATMFGGTYDWANMPETFSSWSGTETEKQAVGKLVYDCCVSVGMNWKGSSASASTSDIDDALRDTFGYANASWASFSFEEGAAETTWEKFRSVVIPNCDARAPAAVAVSRVANGNRYGHAILFTGYGYSDGSLAVRCNFGWTGSGDGVWYLPPLLDASNVYTKIEGLVHNVFPTKTGYIASGRVLDMNGEAVADATVALSDGQTATTDAKGIYAFVAAKGDYTATASKGGVSASRSLSGLGTTSTTSVGNLYDQDIRFTQPLVPSPTVTVGDASNVSFTSATVNYNVTSLGDGATKLVSVTLAYSTSSDFSGALTATKTNQGTGAGTFALTGLSDNTKYYVRVRAENDLGGWSTATGSFTTSAYTAPTVSAPSANVSAGLPLPVTATLSSLGAGSTWVDLVAQASTSPSFAVIEASDTVRATSTGSKSFSLAGLGAGATYYVRVVATGSNGKAATSSAITAKPVDLAAPAGSFTLGTPTRVSIPVTWSMTSLGSGNSSATVHLDYGTSDALGSTLTIGTFNATKSNQSATLSGLEPNTEYHVRLRLVGGGKTFATDPATATTLPVGDPAVAVSVVQRLQRGATLRIAVADIGDAARSATVYVDYGTTTSYGTTKTAGAVSEAGTLDYQITELESETDYCVRVRVVNNGGKTGSATATFKTLEPNDPAFTLDVSESYRSAYFDATVTRIGEGAASAAGYVRWGSSSALSPELGRAPFGKVSSVPATVRASAAGLTAGTTYYYEAVITNNVTGRKALTGSFTTPTAGDLPIGTGYYEPGLIMGYWEGSQWQYNEVKATDAFSYGYTNATTSATLARGAITAYMPFDGSVVNELDGASYTTKNGTTHGDRIWTYDGEMWMESDKLYNFASDYYKFQVLAIDGKTVLEESGDGTGQATPKITQNYKPDKTGWHTIHVFEKTDGHGGGACGNPYNRGQSYSGTGSPFYAISYGLAWNTNGTTSVTTSNTDAWQKLLDSGNRHLFRAKGKQPPMAFLSETPTFGSATMWVPVSIDTAYDNLSLTVYASRSPDGWYFEDRWEKKVVVGSTGAAGAKTMIAEFSGIDASVDWYVSVRLSDGANYDYWSDPVKFTPPDDSAPELGTIAVAATTTSVTLSVPVTVLGKGAASVSVAATLGGATKTATVSAAGGTATLAFDGLAPDSDYSWSVVATGVPTGKTAVASGTARTETLSAVGWFDVKWADDGYGTGTAWWNEAAQRTSGGTWTIPAGDASSLSGSALALALPEGGVLRFTARTPSASKATVTVEGSFAPVLAAAPPDAGNAIAGLCFASGGYRAWNGTQWVALSGAVPAAASTAWMATFDWSQAKPRVRYTIGGTVLTASGSEWIPLATSQSYVTGVGYAGGGSVGDFKASYTGGGYVAPVLSTLEDGGHVPLAFGKDDSNNPTFEITVRNAAKDAWYTVYASDTVDGTYAAVTSVQATADGLKTLSIPAPSSKPARFVRIGVSDDPVPDGTELRTALLP
ncbi:MAG: C10 family peptidase [Kiritimatiellae bacterium]|nr:C10 family peptidase [Kiritimatiellia bacterium]